MKTVAIYLRQSLDRTGERAAVQRQLAACQALCRAKGWTVHGVIYEDNDTSATSLKPRPAYKRLLRDAKDGQFDAIVVWHIDRLCRRMTDLEEVIVLGIPIATATGDIDLSTDVGRLVARILAAVAVGEMERKGARQQAGNQQRAERGIPHASPRPFGYDLVVHRNDLGQVISRGYNQRAAEARAMRTAYATILAGGSIRSIVAAWNAAGFLTSKDQPWSPRSVRDRLLSPVYAGLSYYNGERMAEGQWKAIVPEETWKQTVAVLYREERKTTPGRERRYLLSGLAVCGVEGCGALMATGRASGTSIKQPPPGEEKRKGARTYQCSKHRHLSRKAEPIDEYIEKIVVERLSRADAHDLLLDDIDRPDMADLRERAQTLRARKLELAEERADGILDRQQFETANRRVNAALQEIEAQQAQSSKAEALRDLVGADVAKVWKSLDVDRQHAVVKALMTIRLLPPGRGVRDFDYRTVEVELI